MTLTIRDLRCIVEERFTLCSVFKKIELYLFSTSQFFWVTFPSVDVSRVPHLLLSYTVFNESYISIVGDTCIYFPSLCSCVNLPSKSPFTLTCVFINHIQDDMIARLEPISRSPITGGIMYVINGKFHGRWLVSNFEDGTN